MSNSRIRYRNSIKALYFIGFLWFASCATTKPISWQTGSTAAEIDLPENVESVVILNRVRLAYPYNQTNSTIQNPNNPTVLNRALAGVRNQILEQGYLKVAGSYTDYRHPANGNYPPQLSPLDVKSAARGNDLLLSLEMMSQSISDNYSVEIRRQELGNGLFREVDLYVGKREIPIALGWRLYNGLTGELMDEYEQLEDYFYEAESLQRIQATNLLNANYEAELSGLGNRLGRLYAMRVSPTAHRRTIEIYTDASTSISSGAIAAFAGRWEEAAQTWTEGLENEPKPKKKAMLYHNLAVYAEQNGDNNQARNYARKAANLHPLGVKTQSKVGF